MSRVNVIAAAVALSVDGAKTEEGLDGAPDDVRLVKKNKSVHISQDDDEIITWMFLEDGNFVDGGAFDYDNDCLSKVFQGDAVRFLA